MTNALDATTMVTYRDLIEQADAGGPVRYNGTLPPHPNGDFGIQVLVSETPHELWMAPDLIASVPKTPLGTADTLNPEKEAPLVPAGEIHLVRRRVQQALERFSEQDVTRVRLSREGIRDL